MAQQFALQTMLVYKKQKHDWSPEIFAKLVPLTPNEYRERIEGDLNEMRIAAGIDTSRPTGCQ